MRALYLASVYLHVLAAAVWLGGMAFLGLVLVPVVRRGEDRRQAAALFGSLGVRFRPIGWTCLALLLATGTIQLWARGVRFTDLVSATYWTGTFSRLLAAKLAVVVLILVASAAHDFVVGPRAMALWRAGDADPAALGRLRRRASLLGRATMVLALVALGLGVALVRGLP